MGDRRLDRAFSELGDLIESQGGGEDPRDFGGFADDPVGFVREVIGGDPWRMQEKVAEAVRDCPQVTVRSCHAAGKDWLAARLALWWVYARQGLVILTGPTATQVEEILMRGEVRAAFHRSGLPGELHVRALRPGGEGKAGILAKTATGVSALTGFHDARVLFVITEAQDPEISHSWDAAFACATGAEDRILTLGNPVEQSGRFWRAHRGDSDWRSFKIEASDIPNVRQGETVVPGLLTRQGVDRFATEYGEESGFYKSRVLAQFPEEAEDSLFTGDMLDAAADRWVGRQKAGDLEEAEPIVAALDPARHGPDDSVLAIRRGSTLVEFYSWEGRTDLMELANSVAATLRGCGFASFEKGLRQRDEYGRPERVGERPARGRIVVDEVGVGGGVADRLQEAGFRVDFYNGGRQANADGRYHNRRAEAYWTLRERLVDGEVALPPDDRLRSELLSIRWRATPRGKVQLESKRDLTKRIGNSPDRADAAVMAFAERRQSGTKKTARVFGV